jgi:hypothetical protein
VLILTLFANLNENEQKTKKSNMLLEKKAQYFANIYQPLFDSDEIPKK